MVDDRMTGEVVDPPCYGAGKVAWARRYADEQGLPCQRGVFLHGQSQRSAAVGRVGHPIAVNPDARLKRLARQRGWPIEKFY